MKKIWVSLGDRKLNKVDKWLIKIKNIRENCSHNFRLLVPIPLKESKIKGVFVVYDAETSPHYFERFTARCLKCSEEINFTLKRLCPRCLGEIIEGGLLSREEYLGKKWQRYVPRLYSCSKCKFKGIADEWQNN